MPTPILEHRLWAEEGASRERAARATVTESTSGRGQHRNVRVQTELRRPVLPSLQAAYFAENWRSIDHA